MKRWIERALNIRTRRSGAWHPAVRLSVSDYQLLCNGKSCTRCLVPCPVPSGPAALRRHRERDFSRNRSSRLCSSGAEDLSSQPTSGQSVLLRGKLRAFLGAGPLLPSRMALSGILHLGRPLRSARSDPGLDPGELSSDNARSETHFRHGGRWGHIGRDFRRLFLEDYSQGIRNGKPTAGHDVASLDLYSR